MIEKLNECFKSDQFAIAFDIGSDHNYALSGLKVYQIARKEPNVVSERTRFQKDRLARGIIVDAAFIYVKDFWDVHTLEKQSLDPIRKLTLGTDLGSDICALGWELVRVINLIRS